MSRDRCGVLKKSGFREILLSLILFVFSMAAVARTGELPPPRGPVILTVAGTIERTNVGGLAEFDLDMLLAMPQTQVRTDTFWTDGPQEFSGVPLADLLAHVGADGATLRATALNDYAIEIPVSDASDHGVLLALEHNGALMRVRDKGPIWVVYPNPDDVPEARNRMIWQLRRLDVE